MIKFEELPEMEEQLRKVNKHIERLCESNSPSMQEMMDWVLQSRGKQIRPILTLLCSKLKNKKVDATEMAAIIEMCHTASLIHDDVIDDADQRRGQLSVQKKFGREMAVYAGDYMIFATLARTNVKLKPWFRRMFEKLEVMSDGEVRQFDNRFNTEITEQQCIENIIGKTSAMFEIACGAGAYEGKCNENEVRAVERFAVYFGLLFQLRDDLMDFVSTEQLSKKTIHNDFWCGYYTLPAIHTFQNPQYGEELKQIAKDLKNGIYKDDTDDRIHALIQNAEGFVYTLKLLEDYKVEALKCLDVFKDTVAKKKLIELIDILWISVNALPFSKES